MKYVHEVSITPLTVKADVLTPEEYQQFRKERMKEIQEYKIKRHVFPEADDNEEEKLVKNMNDCLLLAVIKVNGKRVRRRPGLFCWALELRTKNKSFFLVDCKTKQNQRRVCAKDGCWDAELKRSEHLDLQF